MMMDELWPSLEWRVLHQGVNTFHLVRVSCRRAQRWHASLEEEPGPCLQGCTTVSWLLFYLHIPSLPWLATLWICLWELREEGTQKGFCALEPHRVHFGLIQFGRPVMSDSLRPHGLKLTRLPCLSPTPGAYSYSCLSHQWCHPTISPSPPAFNLSQHQGLFKWVSSSN